MLLVAQRPPSTKKGFEMSNVTKDDKTLWHIQSVTEWHDEPYDIFVWAKLEPSRAEIRKLYLAENDGLDPSDDEVQDFVNSANVYSVYPEEL